MAHWGLSSQKQTNETHYFMCGMIIINNKGYVMSLTDSQLSKQFTGPKLPVKCFRYGDEFCVTWGRGLWIGQTSTDCGGATSKNCGGATSKNCGGATSKNCGGATSNNCGGAAGEALRYNPEVRGFDSRWSHWNVSFS